jgi:thiol-disulfide isomerase/thioredoxin
MKAFIFLNIMWLSCSGKTGNAYTKMSVYYNDTIILHSEINAPVSFYYIPGLTGIPIIFTKSSVIKIFSKNPVYFMETSALQIPYILYPGDSLNLYEKDNQPAFESKNATRNHELEFLRVISNKYGSLRPLAKTTYLKGNINVKLRDSIINATYNKRVNFLNGYSREYTLSSSFYNLAREIFFYCQINEKLSLYYPEFNKKIIYNFYKDSLNVYRQYFNCDSCIENTAYDAALTHFIRIQGREVSQVSPMFFFNGLNKKELESLVPLTKQLIGKSRDYILSALYLQILFIANKTKTPLNMDSILTRIQSKDYKKSIEEIYLMLNRKTETGLIANQKFISPNLNSFETFKSLLAKNKGKAMYFDVWATWCVPCISEIPATKKFAKKNADKISVVFLSMDTDTASWKKYILNNALSENSFLLENDFSSVFARNFKITAIPHYILIGNAGKVISADAPSPGDVSLEKLINKDFYQNNLVPQ